MNRYNGRITKLESLLPDEPPEDDNTVLDLAHDVLAAIGDDLIVDYADYPPSDIWDWSGMLSPTVNYFAGMDENDHRRVYGLLYQAQDIVSDFCEITGWQSRLAVGDRRQWMQRRCNSKNELAYVMGVIANE